MQDDQSIGPRAVAIVDRKVYIPDPVHGNIKVLDTDTGNIKVVKLSNRKGESTWLRDVMFFDGKIFITSDLGRIYVVQPSGDVDQINVPRGEKYFAGTHGDTIQVFMPVGGSMLHFDLDKGVVDSESTNYRIYGHTKGRSFSVNRKNDSDEIMTAVGTFKLPVKYQSITDYYDGINVDFTDDSIVYFFLDPEANRMTLLFFGF